MIWGMHRRSPRLSLSDKHTLMSPPPKFPVMAFEDVRPMPAMSYIASTEIYIVPVGAERETKEGGRLSEPTRTVSMPHQVYEMSRMRIDCHVVSESNGGHSGVNSPFRLSMGRVRIYITQWRQCFMKLCSMQKSRREKIAKAT